MPRLPETAPKAPPPVRRVVSFNARARALAEAEALGIDLRNPFGDDSDVLDSVWSARDFARFL